MRPAEASRRVLVAGVDDAVTTAVRRRVGDVAVRPVEGGDELLDCLSAGTACVLVGSGVDGRSLAELIAAVREREGSVPVIAEAAAADLSAALDAGACDAVRADDPPELVACRVERTLDRAEHERTLHRLHEVATDIETADRPEAVYEATVDAATRLLSFDACVLKVERDSLLEPVAASDDEVAAAATTQPVDDGLAGRSYQGGESAVVDDMRDHPVADPSAAFVSGLSVPVGDHGVFQAGHEEPGRFDERDRELAETLASHAAAALSRLDSERRLREQRDTFQTLFDLTPAPVVHAELPAGEPVIRNVNSAFAETFGVDEADAVGASLNDLVATEGRLQDARAVTSQVRAGEPVEREVTRQTPSGDRRFLLRVLPLESGDVPEGIGVYVDVTERSERERLLADLHEVATDIEDCETALSVCEHTLAAAEDLLSFDHCVVFLEEDGVLVPTVATDGLRPEWVRPWATGKALSGTAYRSQEPQVVDDLRATSDANPELPFRSELIVPLGDHGVLAAVDEAVGAFDETDRELAELLVDHAEQALDRIEWSTDIEAERERFSALLDMVSRPVVHARDAVHGPVVIAVNEAFEAVFGYDAEAVVGRSLNEFVVPDYEDARQRAEKLDERLRAGESVATRVTRRTVDGEREFSLRLVPLSDGGESLAVYDPVDEDGDASVDDGTGADGTGTCPPGADAGE